MTAGVLHIGAAQLIDGLQNSQREYEHLLQQGPLARQDIVSLFVSLCNAVLLLCCVVNSECSNAWKGAPVALKSHTCICFGGRCAYNSNFVGD